MPKRWRVIYSGGVQDRFSSDMPDDLSEGGTSTYKDVVADLLDVRGGTLVFFSDGVVSYVFAPDSYWVVVPMRDA
jgi:hypothetical protein